MVGIRGSTRRRRSRSLLSRLGRCGTRQRHGYVQSGAPLGLVLASDVARHLLADERQGHDADIYLLRADGEPIDVFLYRREMLVTGKAAGEGRRCNCVWSGLRGWCRPAVLQR